MENIAIEQINKEDYLDIVQSAKFCNNKSPHTIKKLLKSKKLNGILASDGRKYILKSDLIAYYKSIGQEIGSDISHEEESTESEEVSTVPNTDLVQALKQHIEHLNEALKKSQDALKNQQILQMKTQEKVERLEQTLGTTHLIESPSKKKLSWWARLRGKRES